MIRRKKFIRRSVAKPCAIEHIASGNYCDMTGELPDHTLSSFTRFPSRQKAKAALSRIIPKLPKRAYKGEPKLYCAKII